MELIISPNFVFLDEPTTGLDSATAVSVIKLLKEWVDFTCCKTLATCYYVYSLSNAGRVIILAIHQPRYSIFRLFDSLTLLSNGELMYHGSINSTLDFFGKIGIYNSANMYLRTHTCMHAYLRIMHIHKCIATYMYACIHVHTYTHHVHIGCI